MQGFPDFNATEDAPAFERLPSIGQTPKHSAVNATDGGTEVADNHDDVGIDDNAEASDHVFSDDPHVTHAPGVTSFHTGLSSKAVTPNSHPDIANYDTSANLNEGTEGVREDGVRARRNMTLMSTSIEISATQQQLHAKRFDKQQGSDVANEKAATDDVRQDRYIPDVSENAGRASTNVNDTVRGSQIASDFIKDFSEGSDEQTDTPPLSYFESGEPEGQKFYLFCFCFYDVIGKLYRVRHVHV